MKERAKRAGAQRKEEDGERRSLQVIIIQNILYVMIKPVSSLFFSFTSLLFLLDQAGTDRGGTPKSVQGVSGSEEFTGPERHKCSAAPKHHHHPYTETHHCPQERGETFLRIQDKEGIKGESRIIYRSKIKAALESVTCKCLIQYVLHVGKKMHLTLIYFGENT